MRVRRLKVIFRHYTVTVTKTTKRSIPCYGLGPCVTC